MAQMDGSLQRLVLLDAFLKAQVSELRGRGEESRLRGDGRSTWDPACKVFIGGLKSSMGRLQLKEVFSKFGSVRNCWVAKKPGGFGFVEMGSVRGAERAVRGLNGTQVWGKQVRVAMSHAKENEHLKETRRESETDNREGVQQCTKGRLDSREYRRRDKTRSRDASSEEKEYKRRNKTRSRDVSSEEKVRKGGRRPSEDKISRDERKRSLEKDRTSQHKEREEKRKKDENALSCKNQCKTHQPTKVTYVTGRKKRPEDVETTQAPLSVEAGMKRENRNEASQRWNDKKKEVEGHEANIRKRESSSSSSNSSDWEAPWERAKDDGRKKKKKMKQ